MAVGKSKNLRDCRHTPTVAMTSRLHQLSALGQSVWIDSCRATSAPGRFPATQAA